MSSINNRVAVGVVSQPSGEAGGFSAFGENFVCAGYVKWLQSAGARAVLIPWDALEDTVDRLLSSVNGVLLPGGPQTLTIDMDYFKKIQTIYNKIVEINKKKVYFPLWGTCQGFEQIVLSATNFGKELLIDYYEGMSNVALPLEFTEGSEKSRIFHSSGIPELDRVVYRTLGTENVTPNYHSNGVKPESFERSRSLKIFRVLSTNKDVNDEPFVSMIEGRDLPIYGVQWHPTLQIYEYGSPYFSCLEHSKTAILAMQYLGNFFIDEMRRNDQAISEGDLNRFGFNNLKPTYTIYISGGPIFEQTYFFGAGAENP